MLNHRRPKVLFILGNHHHNTMLHKVANELPECERWFTPYYCDDWSALDVLRRLGLLEYFVLGRKTRRETLDYCAEHGLQVDLGGRRGGYDLAVTCTDLLIQRNIRHTRIVGVQEGVIDPPAFWFKVRKYLPWLPRWAISTTALGLSGMYDRYCVASDGYIEEFAARGAPADRLVATGMPDFDDLARLRKPGHWIEGHVLACTTDGREIFRPDNRAAFIRWALEIAKGRPLVFKFHPNEKMSRASAEVRRLAPGARYLVDSSMGSGEELAANCEVLITEWSTLTLVGLVLGKETYSYRDLHAMRPLLPLQHGRAAINIANVCREVLDMPVTSESLLPRASAPRSTGS